MYQRTVSAGGMRATIPFLIRSPRVGDGPEVGYSPDVNGRNDREVTVARQWTCWATAIVALACGEARSNAKAEVAETIESEVVAAAAEEEAGAAGPSVAGAPQVGERYQRTVDRAWEKAVAGETPAYACAGLKGRLMGNDEAATDGGREALFACNVLAPVRYFETLLDGVDAGEATCQDVMMALMTQLPAMTLSIDGIQGMMDAMEADPQRGMAAGLRTVVDDATMAKGLDDPKALVKERLAERMESSCPELAGSMPR